MTKRIHGRHGARWVALQGLYAWVISGKPLTRIHEDLVSEEVFIDRHNQEKPMKISYDKAYLHELLQAIGARSQELDDMIAPYLDRRIDELNPIEHAILRIATYELMTRIEIPYKVVINEAIILAKLFGAQDSHRFVNGVLDKAAQVIRESEFQAL